MVFSKTKECLNNRIIFQDSYISSLAIGVKKRSKRQKIVCSSCLLEQAGQCVGELQGHYYCPLEGALWSIVTRLDKRQMDDRVGFSVNKVPE